ncbi:MAG: class I SAM-dependent methyltransferase [Candidatus Helarchaeota archaeon]
MTQNSDKNKIEKMKHYDSIEEIKKYDKERFLNIYGSLLHNIQKNYISDYLNDVKNDIALDLATGTGRFLFNYLENFRCVIGIDVALNMLKFLRKKFRKFVHYKNVNLIRADIDNLPIKPNKINFISAIHIVLHLKKYSDILIEAYRVLNKNGIFIFDIPNKDFIIRRILNFILKNRKNYYISTKYNLKEIKNYYKFKNINVKKYYIRGVAIFIIYLYPKLMRKFLNRFLQHNLILKILILLEKFFSNKYFIFKYLSSDLLIAIKK